MKQLATLVSPSVESFPSCLLPSPPEMVEGPAPKELLAVLLDHVTCALLLVGRGRRIVYANASAQADLADGTYLRSLDGVLMLKPSVQSALVQAIAIALEPDVLRSGAARSIVLAGAGRAFRIAYVQPFRGTDGAPSPTHALVALPAPAVVGLEQTDAFARAYSLTATEQRVLVHIVNGATLKATAGVLRIAGATVTTHMKHIFDKTGVRRQSEIIALFLQSLPPLRL